MKEEKDKEIKENNSKKHWFVYLVECGDSSFYCGVTNNLDKRMSDHADGKGAKYTKIKGFSKLLHFRECDSRSDAQKCEHYIKGLNKWDKINWFLESEN